MSQPFVTALIDTYNHEAFIEKAIESVLQQDFPLADLEIIVVDDGSTDRTAEIVAFLDGDDWWFPSKLTAVSGALESNREVGVVGHGVYRIREGVALSPDIPKRCYKNFLRDEREALELSNLLSFLGTSRLTVRREVLRQALPVADTLLADLYLAVVATAISGALILDQGLVNYRLHSANLYQFHEQDGVRMRQKLEGLRSFCRELPPRLREKGMCKEAIDVLTAPMRMDSERLRLALGEGWSWETVRIERAAFRQAYDRASPGYYLFHLAVLASALILPPRLFYRARHFYTERGLRRFRDFIGRAEPAESL
ncbi:MAG: glycosyl transferase [Candidatus Acidoferrum typicum]|nr:glycosyl transferase [Candidatus Acidoferrum typicum]